MTNKPPFNGEKVKLGDVCDILNGYAFKSKKYVNTGIRVIRIANVQKGYISDSEPKFYPESEAANISGHLLEENDLLVSLTGNVGRVALLDKKLLPAALNQRVGCLRLRVNSPISKKFLYHLLNSNWFEGLCIENANGAAQLNLSTQWLKNIEISLYTSDMQLRLVDLFDTLQNCIQLAKEQKTQLNQLVKSRFIEMFGDPCDSAAASVESQPINTFCELRIGPFGSTLHKEDYIYGGYPLVNPSHIIRGQIKTDKNLTVNEKKYTSMAPYHLHIGDVVLGRRGEIGRCAVVEQEGFICGTGSMILRPNTNICRSDYLQRVIAFPAFASALEKEAVGVTMKNLNAKIVGNAVVVLPPLSLQQEFADFVAQVDKSQFLIQQQIDKLQTLYDSLAQEYFG